MIEERYYSIKEVSKKLKVSYLSVYRWVRAKKLVAYKIGKQYRIRTDDIQSFMKKH